jgi:hypothetical protein
MCEQWEIKTVSEGPRCGANFVSDTDKGSRPRVKKKTEFYKRKMLESFQNERSVDHTSL